VNGYSSPFPQNHRYFADIASRINWTDVDSGITTITTNDLRRFRAIGDFLKTQELPEVLSWKALDDARPRLGKTDRNRKILVRSCLNDLGQFLVERGLLQDWNSYSLDRRLQSLKSTPAVFRDHIGGFQQWVLGGMLNPRLQLRTESVNVLTNDRKVLVSTVSTINRFLRWCVADGVASLAEIDDTVISNYHATLYWKLECRECGNCVPFQTHGAPKKCTNKECVATNSYKQVRYLARNTRIGIASRLRVFFDWAHLHGLIANNPVGNTGDTTGPKTFTVIDERGNTIEVAEAIRRYDDSVIEKLCAYIVAPKAEPEVALILYLVIFHLLTPAELCNVKIPSLVRAGSSGRASDGSEDYRYLILPLRKPTRGRRLGRRTEEKIRFPRKSLPWLVPLLKRFYEKRKSQVKGHHREYLFAHRRGSRHNIPVSTHYLSSIARRPFRNLLGGDVNIFELRQTSAAIFSQRSKRRFAVLTRMGYGRRWATRFCYLETFILKPKAATPTAQKKARLESKGKRCSDPAIAPA
jgi:hypothetical protein